MKPELIIFLVFQIGLVTQLLFMIITQVQITTNITEMLILLLEYTVVRVYEVKDLAHISVMIDPLDLKRMVHSTFLKYKIQSLSSSQILF